MGNTRKKLGLAGLLLAGISILSPAQAQDKEPTKLDNFDYASHRNYAGDEKCYEGIIFNYNLLSDATIVQSDKKGVNIRPIYFYDIDNDGKFGKAETDAIKKGIPIFMHEAFNDLANAKVRKFLEIAVEYSSLSKKLKQEEKNSQIYQKRINELEAKLIEYQSQLQKTETPELSWEIRKPKQKEDLPLPEIPEVKETTKEKNKGVYLSLLTQGNSNFAFDAFGGSLGLRVNPFEKLDIGFGANLDVDFSLDKLIDSYTGELSAGRTASGTIEDTNKYSIGLSAEAQLGPFILGAGADYSNWIRKTVEQILDSSGSALKSNTNSLANGKITGKLYGGLEVPLTDAWKLGAIGGYDWNKGPYFGIRNVFRLNQPKKKK